MSKPREFLCRLPSTGDDLDLEDLLDCGACCEVEVGHTERVIDLLIKRGKFHVIEKSAYDKAIAALKQAQELTPTQIYQILGDLGENNSQHRATEGESNDN